MKDFNERPICHRAEDLVTYLYNEGSEADARDFAMHAEVCDACRTELAVFAQVHDSILLWRNEALGAAFTPATAPAPLISNAAANASQSVPEPRLSALDAVREFFRVSPLWLRGATAFAGLTLFVLAALLVLRSWNQPAPLVNNQPGPSTQSQQQFEAAVAQEVKRQMDEMRRKESAPQTNVTTSTDKPEEKIEQPQLAVNRTPAKTARQRGLTRQEREQLAADLRLIPRDEDELPFGLADEPKQ